MPSAFSSISGMLQIVQRSFSIFLFLFACIITCSVKTYWQTVVLWQSYVNSDICTVCWRRFRLRQWSFLQFSGGFQSETSWLTDIKFSMMTVSCTFLLWQVGTNNGLYNECWGAATAGGGLGGTQRKRESWWAGVHSRIMQQDINKCNYRSVKICSQLLKPIMNVAKICLDSR